MGTFERHRTMELPSDPVQARSLGAVIKVMTLWGGGGLDPEQHSKEEIMASLKETYTEDVTVDYSTTGVSCEQFKCHTGHEELYAFLQFLIPQMKPGSGWAPEFHSAPGSNRVFLYHGDEAEWVVNGTSGIVPGTIAAFVVNEEGKVSSFKQYHADGPAMEQMFGTAWK